MRRPFIYGYYFFGGYWLIFVFSLIYLLKSDYSFLLYFVGLPFRTYMDSNIAYVLNAFVYFCGGLIVGFIVELIMKRVNTKRVDEKLRAFNTPPKRFLPVIRKR